MAKESPAQQRTVERVMHEFKHGELEKRDGKPVKDRTQAIAIALHEAGASNREDPKANERNLAHTKLKERAETTARDSKEGGGATKAALYARAKRKGIPGRSSMSKSQLAEAVRG